MARNVKLIAVKSPKYRSALPGLFEVYSLKVIRLAREAMRVPVPPILTPTSRVA